MPITLKCDSCGREYRYVAGDLIPRTLDGAPHAAMPIGMRFVLRYGWTVKCAGTLRATEPLETQSAEVPFRELGVVQK